MKKLAIIIGGSRGLGAALCEQFLAEGYELIECSRTGTGPAHHYVDLSRRETSIDTLDALFAQSAQADFQEITLVLNSAVLTPFGPLYQSEPKDWWMNLDINLTLPISIMGCFQRHFKTYTAKKQIAFLSSGAATGAMDGWGLYSAAKAGVEQFLRCMALEQQVLEYPIAVVSLNPGIMDTDMQAQIRAAGTELFSRVKQFQQFKTQEQLAAPAVVAKNIMTTLQAPFTSGETLYVGG